MKILKGSLTETRYAMPEETANVTEKSPLEVLAKTTHVENQVTYMSDKLGIHRVSNPDTDNYAVSLHCKLTRFQRLLCFDNV
jgi:cysteine dioxygenase